MGERDREREAERLTVLCLPRAAAGLDLESFIHCTAVRMALLLMFVIVLHLVTLAMLFISTMEKVNPNASQGLSVLFVPKWLAEVCSFFSRFLRRSYLLVVEMYFGTHRFVVKWASTSP